MSQRCHQRWSPGFRRSLPLQIAAACLLAVGCGRPPAVQYHNLTLISSLRTAISAKNPTWLEGVSKAVESRRNEAEMSEEEYEHFQSIIAEARSGRWEQAERDCFRFEEAQLNRRRPPPAASDADHH